MKKSQRILWLIMVAGALAACGGNPTDTPGPTADSIPVAAECEAVATQGTPTGLQPLIPDPGSSRGPRCYGIPANTEITFAWADVPFGYDTVELFRVNENGLQEIGRDDNLGDGLVLKVMFDAEFPPTAVVGVATDIDGGNPPLTSDRLAVFIEE